MAAKIRGMLTAAIGTAVSLCLAEAAGAQNLVVNGDFATDPSGWDPAAHAPAISIAWSPLDPADPTPSGSLEVTTIISTAGSGGPTQCVDLLVANPQLAMDVLVPSQPAFNYVLASPFVRWFDATGCSGDYSLTESPIGEVPDDSSWTHLEGSLSPPGSAQSVLIDLGVRKPGGSSAPAVAYFDNVYLPEPGAPALAVAAVAVLAALETRRSSRRAASTRRRCS